MTADNKQSGIDIRRDDRPAFGLHGWRKWLALGAVWTLLGTFGAARLYYTYNYSSPGLVSWTDVLAMALTDWYLWGAFSPFIYYLAGRWPLHRGDWLRQIGLQILLAAVFGLAQVTVYTQAFLYVRDWFNIGLVRSYQTFTPVWVELVVGKLYVAMMTYLLIAFVSHAIHYYRQYRTEQERLARAEMNLTAARLETLMGQLQPHFLFNTLNAVSALIHTDPEGADRMIARLSDLLRLSLEQKQEQFCRLDRELDFVRKYLEIQQVRFADRLTVEISVSPELSSLTVPALLLQPLVENAVRHGIAPLARPGKVTVAASRTESRLRIVITDTGPGLPVVLPNDRAGRGIRLTRERLQALYPSDHTFDIGSAPGGGTILTLDLPANDHSATGDHT